MKNIDPNKLEALEDFKDEAYDQAVTEFPVGSWVYVIVTQQVSTVEEVRPSADGPRLKITGIGSVPITELRAATPEEIQDQESK